VLGCNFFVTGGVVGHVGDTGAMGRDFSFEYAGRKFYIRPFVVDEGWELWVMDGQERLECGGTISIDEAVIAAREGHDSIQIAADRLKATVLARFAAKS